MRERAGGQASGSEFSLGVLVSILAMAAQRLGSPSVNGRCRGLGSLVGFQLQQSRPVGGELNGPANDGAALRLSTATSSEEGWVVLGGCRRERHGGQGGSALMMLPSKDD